MGELSNMVSQIMNHQLSFLSVDHIHRCRKRH